MYPLAATYQWKDVPKIIGLASLYLFFAVVSIAFATVKGPLLLICLPSGLALAALLLFGIKYWPGVLIGAIVTSILKGYTLHVAIFLGLFLTMQTMLGVWLLKRAGFNLTMPRARDFFYLFLLAGIVASGAAALSAMLLLKFSASNSLNLWFSNLLGITLVTSFILIWRQPFWEPPLRHQLPSLLTSGRAYEFFILMITSVIAGQIVFLDLFIDTIGIFPLEYLAFIFVVWAALRFGRHGVLVILAITFTQAMISVRKGTGYFGSDIVVGELFNFSIYCSELLVIGMLLACAIRERNTSTTAAKLNEARVKRLTRLYQTLSQLSQGFMRLKSEAELFPLVCRTVVKHGGMKMAWVGVPGQAKHLLEPVACFGKDVSYLDKITIHQSRYSGIRGPAAIALAQNRQVIINNLVRNPNHARARYAAEYGYHSVGAFPIQRSGKPFAILTVYSDKENSFDEDAIALLKEMSLDISFALDNFQREEQRRIAEKTVKTSEERFRAFFERSMIGMATCDVDGRWLEVNDSFCHTLGYERSDLLQLKWSCITHPDDVPVARSLFNRSVRRKINEFEIDGRYICKDGTIVFAHIAVRCLRKDDGSINYFACLMQDVTESKKTAELIWKQANFDQLTGLINRNLFHDRLQLEIKKSHRTKMPLALVYIDLDRFKEVNDSLGHASGDALLIEAAKRIESCVRASDTLARLGGDEFVIIISQCPDRAPVNQIANKVISRLGEPFILGSDTAFVTASIGVAFYPDDAADMESLLSHADQAMYASKNQGRSRLNYFTRSMREASQLRLAMVNDLRNALSANQFQLYFQPIIELSTNRILKAEALLRWNHPTNGLIEPNQFIPLAEETGMIFNIGDWVFREAARWAHRWSRYQQDGVQVSVNKSPMQFMVQSIEPSQWIDHLHELGVPGRHIAIEITEGLLMHAEPIVMEKLLKFRDAGIQVSLDDFGTGYSALSYLNKFDIDYLKIDQSFIRNLVTDPADKALSEAIIVMAHTLGLSVIAEGVETEAQRALLRAAGCDFAQGFLFSPPVPGIEFEAMLH